MANDIEIKYNFLPWLRKGLSRKINETDYLAKENLSTITALKRAQVLVTTTFELTNKNLETTKKKEVLPISLVGPGDILGIKEDAVLQMVPANGITNFESNYFPFIEFFEVDFPWRYSPISPNSENANALRPWLTLIVCKKEEYSIEYNSNGQKSIRLKVLNQQDYSEILGSPEEIHKNAHVQLVEQTLNKEKLNEKINTILDKDQDLGISRVLTSRKLEDYTSYRAFLIPSFETGRLAGLNLSNENVAAQKSAWETTLEQQLLNRPQALDFPVYLDWEFETSNGDFATLVRKIHPSKSDAFPAGLKVDVSNIGSGLNYTDFSPVPKRNTIDVFVATKPIELPKNFSSTAFPAESITDEKIIFDRLKMLLSQSPDFAVSNESLKDVEKGLNKIKLLNNNPDSPIHKRIKEEINKTSLPSRLPLVRLFSMLNELEDPEKTKPQTRTTAEANLEDPWIVPPVYGAKHAMAKSLNPEDNINHKWFHEINLDIRYRIAAGLGKKIVQNNQEEFIQRAWEQVELINDLNQKIKEFLLQKKLNERVYKKGFSRGRSLEKYRKKTEGTTLNINIVTSKKLVTELIDVYYPFKHLLTNDKHLLTNDKHSLNTVLLKNNLPSSLASTAFHQLSNKKRSNSNHKVSLTESVVDYYINNYYHHQIDDLITIDQINELVEFYKKNTPIAFINL